MFALADCGGGESAGNASCRSELQRYLDCGLFDGGFEGTCHSELETQYARCKAACVEDASCSELEDFICNDDPNSCLNHCASDNFRCDSGQEVDSQDECNGAFDCNDLSDEADCDVPIFRCSDFSPQKIDGDQVCNGSCDCAENCSDEDECGQFTCVE